MISSTAALSSAISGQKPLDLILGGVVLLLLITLVVRRVVHERNLKRRKGASRSYHDSDVAKYGTGPAGFAGAASARSTDGTSLAPSFAASDPGAPGSEPAPSPTFSGVGPQVQGGQAPPGSPTSATDGLPMFGAQPAPPAPPPPQAPRARPGPSPTTGGQAPPPPPATGLPAGWLPDPGGDPNMVRYWSGDTWTDHTARRA